MKALQAIYLYIFIKRLHSIIECICRSQWATTFLLLLLSSYRGINRHMEIEQLEMLQRR